MIRAKHHIILFPFFKSYVLWKMKSSFASCEIFGEVPDQNKAILWIANHISWWDGIWVLGVNQKLFGRKFHFMMLEEQLRKNWFFKYTGGFSVRKESRSAIESLRYAAELLNHPENMVLMFPQGEIQSMQRHRFKFEKGVERILSSVSADVQVIFQANFLDYLSKPKPTLFQYIGEYKGTSSYTEMEEAYNRFYLESKNIQSTKKS